MPRPLVQLSWLAFAGCAQPVAVAPDPVDPPAEEAPRVPLADRLTAETLRPHIDALAAIGAANAGTRAWASPGHAASVDYAVDVLTAAGFSVDVVTSEFDLGEIGESTLEIVAPTSIAYVANAADGYIPFAYAAAGDVTAAVTAVDVQVPPGAEPNTSNSGCEMSDFAAFPAGDIALLQRGTCNFAVKVANAEAAGASAVVIFNEGQAERTEAIYGHLDVAAPAGIPAVFVAYDVGAAWVDQLRAGDLTAHLSVAYAPPRTLRNVVAERPGADPSTWLWVGAHLDSVDAGPGVNDNGSGSALVLALAEAVDEAGLASEVGLRLSLWDGEEWGLLGSSAVVSERGVRGTVAYLNFDMIGSPNGGTFVYDGDDSNEGLDFGNTLALVDGMDRIEAAFRDALADEGQSASEVSRDIPTDSAPFLSVGVPVGGLFSGAFHPLTDDEAAAWGGVAGVAHDPCYHLACDDGYNINDALLDTHARAAGVVIEAMLQGELALEPTSPQKAPPRPMPRIVLPDGHEAAPWFDEPW